MQPVQFVSNSILIRSISNHHSSPHTHALNFSVNSDHAKKKRKKKTMYGSGASLEIIRYNWPRWRGSEYPLIASSKLKCGHSHRSKKEQPGTTKTVHYSVIHEHTSLICRAVHFTFLVHLTYCNSFRYTEYMTFEITTVVMGATVILWHAAAWSFLNERHVLLPSSG